MPGMCGWEMNTSEDMEKRYVAALEKQLQEEKMVTFKLSQQNETMLQLLVETKKMHLRYEDNRDWLERRDKIIRGDITP